MRLTQLTVLLRGDRGPGNAAGRPVDSGHTLAVANGASLWSLAAQHLGGGPRWTCIFMLNYQELGDPDLIFAGATLKMPEPYRPAGP